ncbi:hypothetical protein Hamer_G025747, partial [Homarus americanus]
QNKKILSEKKFTQEITRVVSDQVQHEPHKKKLGHVPLVIIHRLTPKIMKATHQAAERPWPSDPPAMASDPSHGPLIPQPAAPDPQPSS